MKSTWIQNNLYSWIIFFNFVHYYPRQKTSRASKPNLPHSNHINTRDKEKISQNCIFKPFGTEIRTKNACMINEVTIRNYRPYNLIEVFNFPLYISAFVLLISYFNTHWQSFMKILALFMPIGSIALSFAFLQLAIWHIKVSAGTHNASRNTRAIPRFIPFYSLFIALWHCFLFLSNELLYFFIECVNLHSLVVLSYLTTAIVSERMYAFWYGKC